MVFDVRFLPNPNYVPTLKKKTGQDAEVRKYVKSFPRSKQCLSRLFEFISDLLPNYLREGKSYLTVSIGCTGGRHRSVAIAEDLGERLSDTDYLTDQVLRREHLVIASEPSIWGEDQGRITRHFPTSTLPRRSNPGSVPARTPLEMAGPISPIPIHVRGWASCALCGDVPDSPFPRWFAEYRKHPIIVV